jgi:hypothetical protein
MAFQPVTQSFVAPSKQCGAGQVLFQAVTELSLAEAPRKRSRETGYCPPERSASEATQR